MEAGAIPTRKYLTDPGPTSTDADPEIERTPSRAQSATPKLIRRESTEPRKAAFSDYSGGDGSQLKRPLDVFKCMEPEEEGKGAVNSLCWSVFKQIIRLKSSLGYHLGDFFNFSVFVMFSAVIAMVALHLIEENKEVHTMLQTISEVDWLPTKVAKGYVSFGLEWYTSWQKEYEDFWVLNAFNKVAPGILFKVILDHSFKFWQRLAEKYYFEKIGFKNRVSITINLLVPNKDPTQPMHFEMRTIRDVALMELVPSEAAKNLVVEAGKRVKQKENGPELSRPEKDACFGIKWLPPIFCMKPYKNRCCCCCPKCIPCLCGKSKIVNLDFDPILRFQKRDKASKKFIKDQIKNLLSESTTGRNFIGWQMSQDSYESKSFYWCLTYEQPLDVMKKDTDLFQTANFQNRKFRILMADEMTIQEAMEKQPWEVFVSKPSKDYTSYCDRRWSHLQKMGHIIEMQKGKEVLVDPTNNKVYTKDIVGDNARKIAKSWADFFLVDKIEVVVPKNDISKLTERTKELSEQIELISPVNRVQRRMSFLSSTDNPISQSSKAHIVAEHME
jgi:hypothetical protein